MEFEWDEAKREANLAKHGIDFLDAISIWRGDVIDPAYTGAVDQETRILAIGAPQDTELLIWVVYTIREERRRIISVRRARRNERKTYQNKFGRGR
jgi:uncharacterized DUF497 family protein